MPERELPEHLVTRLSEELTAGAPLRSPLPSQARYAGARAGLPSGFARWRLVSAAAAAAALIVVAVAAGPTSARQWIGTSVGNLTRDLEGADARHSGPSPSPGRSSPGSAVQPSPHESPEPTETQEPQESPEPADSPEPSESPDGHGSPQPSQSPDGDGAPGGQQPSPSPEPSDGGSDGGGGGTDGGG